LRIRYARETIVVLTLVFPVARTIRAIVVGIGIVRNGPTDAVDAAAFFGRAARHTFVVAFAIATKTVDAKRRWTLIVRRARQRIRWWRQNKRRVLVHWLRSHIFPNAIGIVQSRFFDCIARSAAGGTSSTARCFGTTTDNSDDGQR
jgi:hypothetical protein